MNVGEITASQRAIPHDPLAFRENILVEARGATRRFGSVVTPLQAKDFEATDPAWRWLAFRNGDAPGLRFYFERRRGGSKTTDLAISAAWALAFAKRKLGMVAAAADQDQARLLADAIDGLIGLNSWLGSFLRRDKYKVVNQRTGSVLEILPADTASSWGLTPDAVLIDELSVWPPTGEGLWHSLFSSASKKPCLVQVISNAGFGRGTSWQWHVREAARTSGRWHFSRWPGPAEWTSADTLAEMKDTLPPAVYARLFLNEWSSGEGDGVAEEWIKRAVTLKLGADTAFSATDAASAMAYLAKSGFDVARIMAVMKPTLDLAAAGGMDAATAADVMAKSLSGMGLSVLEAAKLVDMLAAASTNANTDLVQLGEAFKYSGPVAAATGRSVEEATAALMILGNAGIQASMGGTTLRGVYTDLTGATSEAAKVFKQLGVSMVTADGRAKPLARILREVNAATRGMSEAGRTGLMLKAFGERGGPGFLAMLAAGDAQFTRFQTLLENSAGTANKIATTMLDNLAGSWEALKGSVETLSITIGSALIPPLRSLAARLTSLANAAAEDKDALASLEAKANVLGTGAIATVLGSQVLTWTQNLAVLGATAGGAAAGGIAALAAGVGVLATQLGKAAALGPQMGTIWERLGTVNLKLLQDLGVFGLTPVDTILGEQARTETSQKAETPQARFQAATADLEAAKADLAAVEADYATAQRIMELPQGERIAALTRMRNLYNVGGAAVFPQNYAPRLAHVVARRKANLAAAETRLDEARVAAIGETHAASIAATRGQTGNAGTSAVMREWEKAAAWRRGERQLYPAVQAGQEIARVFGPVAGALAIVGGLVEQKTGLGALAGKGAGKAGGAALGLGEAALAAMLGGGGAGAGARVETFDVAGFAQAMQERAVGSGEEQREKAMLAAQQAIRENTAGLKDGLATIAGRLGLR